MDYPEIFLRGAKGPVEFAIRRLTNAWGGELTSVNLSGDVPVFNLNRGGRRLALLILEELPNSRCHFWVHRITDELTEPERKLVSEFWEFIGAELDKLGFAIRANPIVPEADSDSLEKFSAEDQEEISRRLDALTESVLQSYEFSQEEAEWLRREIAFLKQELANSSRIEWRHIARSVLLGAAGMIGGQAGRFFLEEGIERLRPFLGKLLSAISSLRLLGPG